MLIPFPVIQELPLYRNDETRLFDSVPEQGRKEGRRRGDSSGFGTLCFAYAPVVTASSAVTS
jgi:hypothetical protein